MYPDPLFNIFGIDIDLYSICFLVGLIACFVFTYIAMKKSGYSTTARDTILIIGLFAISLGLMFGVLVQSIYDFIANPSGGFKITGKMTFLGGLLGGVIVYLGIYFLYVLALSQPKAPVTKSLSISTTSIAYFLFIFFLKPFFKHIGYILYINKEK